MPDEARGTIVEAALLGQQSAGFSNTTTSDGWSTASGLARVRTRRKLEAESLPLVQNG
jgi:hypothetical protein